MNTNKNECVILKNKVFMANEKNTVMVELQDLILTDKKDDRFSRVVTTKSLKEDDLIHLAVQRRIGILRAGLL
jgi:hypothetical protein